MRIDHVAIFEFNPKLRVGKCVNDGSFHFNMIFFWHSHSLFLSKFSGRMMHHTCQAVKGGGKRLSTQVSFYNRIWSAERIIASAGAFRMPDFLFESNVGLNKIPAVQIVFYSSFFQILQSNSPSTHNPSPNLVLL